MHRGRERGNEGLPTRPRASRRCRPEGQLTAEIEQVGEEEGLLVEVFDGHHDGPIQTAAEGLLRPALICYQRLQHGAHHVELGGGGVREKHVQ